MPNGGVYVARHDKNRSNNITCWIFWVWSGNELLANLDGLLSNSNMLKRICMSHGSWNLTPNFKCFVVVSPLVSINAIPPIDSIVNALFSTQYPSKYPSISIISIHIHTNYPSYWYPQHPQYPSIPLIPSKDTQPPPRFQRFMRGGATHGGGGWVDARRLWGAWRLARSSVTRSQSGLGMRWMTWMT